MGIGMLLVIAAAVVLVVLLVRLLSQPHPATAGQIAPATVAAAYPAAPEAQAARPSGVTQTPREIVQRRYAAGEIDRDEYLQKPRTSDAGARLQPPWNWPAAAPRQRRPRPAPQERPSNARQRRPLARTSRRG